MCISRGYYEYIGGNHDPFQGMDIVSTLGAGGAAQYMEGRS